jgi:hypothetical protein
MISDGFCSLNCLRGSKKRLKWNQIPEFGTDELIHLGLNHR